MGFGNVGLIFAKKQKKKNLQLTKDSQGRRKISIKNAKYKNDKGLVRQGNDTTEVFL